MKPALRRHLLNTLRVLLIAAGLGYIVYIVQWSDQWVTPATGGEPVLRPGMITMLKAADLRWLLGGFVLLGVIFPLQALRWWWLMRCRGLRIAWWSVMRLTMIGVFFNFCVPVGSNGGDVVKAYGAARSTTTPGSTAISLISVLIDRVAGLTGMIVLATAMGLVMWPDPMAQKIAVVGGIVIVALVLGSVVYVNATTRKWLGINALTRFSIFARLDEAVTGYRHHPGVLVGVAGLSLPVHIASAVAIGMAGYALGLPTPMLTLLAVVPIVLITGALPLTFLGLGVMELTAEQLLITESSGVTTNQVAGMLMLFRVDMLLYAGLGGLLMLSKGLNLRENSPPTDSPA